MAAGDSQPIEQVRFPGLSADSSWLPYSCLMAAIMGREHTHKHTSWAYAQRTMSFSMCAFLKIRNVVLGDILSHY